MWLKTPEIKLLCVGENCNESKENVEKKMEYILGKHVLNMGSTVKLLKVLMDYLLRSCRRAELNALIVGAWL